MVITAQTKKSWDSSVLMIKDSYDAIDERRISSFRWMVVRFSGFRIVLLRPGNEVQFMMLNIMFSYCNRDDIWHELEKVDGMQKCEWEKYRN